MFIGFMVQSFVLVRAIRYMFSDKIRSYLYRYGII